MHRVGAFWLVPCNRLVAAKLELKNGTKRREREDNTRLNHRERKGRQLVEEQRTKESAGSRKRAKRKREDTQHEGEKELEGRAQRRQNKRK